MEKEISYCKACKHANSKYGYCKNDTCLCECCLSDLKYKINEINVDICDMLKDIEEIEIERDMAILCLNRKKERYGYRLNILEKISKGYDVVK